MTDILSESDIKLLVDEFYKKVVVDPVIGFIFNDVVKLSWEKHIPVMYAFWSSLLLGTNTFTGNPMGKHINLDKKILLTKIHFDKWLELWDGTVNENFKGANADEAKTRAKHIAGLMLFKVEQSR